MHDRIWSIFSAISLGTWDSFASFPSTIDLKHFFNLKWYRKLLAFVRLINVSEVVLLSFFEVLLEKRLTLSYVPNFQGHTMPCLEMVAV